MASILSTVAVSGSILKYAFISSSSKDFPHNLHLGMFSPPLYVISKELMFIMIDIYNTRSKESKSTKVPVAEK